eukprot:5177608-Amphidinium_carterae.1
MSGETQRGWYGGLLWLPSFTGGQSAPVCTETQDFAVSKLMDLAQGDIRLHTDGMNTFCMLSAQVGKSVRPITCGLDYDTVMLEPLSR